LIQVELIGMSIAGRSTEFVCMKIIDR